MTEHSYWHNGSMRGDATESPYNADIFKTIFSQLVSSSRNGILADETALGMTNLAVSASGLDMEIDVSAGSAFIEGIYFNNSASTALTIDPISTHAGQRIDRVVIRIDWEAQTARLAVVKGEEVNSYPTSPTLQQDTGKIFEYPLAKIGIIYSVTAVIVQTMIFDERIFLPTAQSAPIMNFMHNSEFIYGANDAQYAPAYWYISGGTPTVTNYITPNNTLTERGNIIRLVSPSGGPSINTDVFISNASSTLYPAFSRATIAFYLHVISGGAEVSFNGTTTNILDPTSEPVLIKYRLALSSLAAYISLSIAFAGEVHLYPVTLSWGLIEAPFVPCKEIVLAHYPSYSPEGFVNGAGAVTRNALAGLFNIPLPYYMTSESALIVGQHVYDSGSSGGDSYYYSIGSQNFIRTEVGRLPDSIKRHSIGIVPKFDPISSSILATAVSSGANTMRVGFTLVGVIT